MPADADRIAFERLPASVLRVTRALADAGHEAVLVGGCVRDLLRGVPVADFDIATSAPPAVVLGLFPRAVPIGLAHGTVMVPTASGPIDITTYRSGPELRDDLAHRDFTLNALAWDPQQARLVDPFGGRQDLAQGRLRAVGSARERFAEDPLRVLRAARLVATLGVRPDAELEAAMAGASLVRVAHERVRRELGLLLLAPAAGEALSLLRRSGVETQLAPGAAGDASAVVPALPCDLELRLAGWLRGPGAGALLRRLRFPRRASARVERLLRLHPIETLAEAEHAASVRRLLRRAGDDFAALVALRRAELERGEVSRSAGAAAAAERLLALERAAAQIHRSGALALHRFDLALRGEDVMRILGCRPGPAVGHALRFLTECVIEDPSCNTPERLRSRLATWTPTRAEASTV